MDRFLSIQAFVRVAETRSFAAAARRLGTAKSVITARVRHLEEFVGASLFHRTTRHVSLSEVGQAYLQECADLIRRADQLVDHIREVRGAPAGVLRVHALPGFVLSHLSGPLRKFQDSYPEIMLDFVVNDMVIDPIKEGFDCTLQIFSPFSDMLIERRLFAVRRVFCATPRYLEQYGEPRCPGDLLQHRLALYSRYPTRDRWTFHRGGDQQMLELKPALKTNSVHLLRDYALADAAAVCIPTLVASDDILAGRLRLLLPEYQLTSFWLSAVYAPTHRGSFKLKLFLESMTSAFSGEPSWDRSLMEKGLIAPGLIE